MFTGSSTSLSLVAVVVVVVLGIHENIEYST